MANFYEHLDWETSRTLESLSRLSLELRNARDVVQRHYGIGEPGELAARILAGDVAEHPGWEHYLGLRILVDTREAVRAAIAAGGRGDTAALSLHVGLKAFVDAHHADDLAVPARLTQDALELSLKNGVTVTVHYATPDDYALRWRAADADGRVREAGIDTAPLHSAPHAALPSRASQPNHMHLADGRVVADTLTQVGAEPAENLRALLDVLCANPAYGLED